MLTIKIRMPPDHGDSVLAVTTRRGQIRLQSLNGDGKPTGAPVFIPDDPRFLAILTRTLIEPHATKAQKAA